MSGTIRPPAPDGPQFGPGGPDPADGPARPRTGDHRWRLRPLLPILKAVGALLFLIAGVWSATGHDRAGLLVGVAAAIALGTLAVRDLLTVERLVADAAGVTVVTGFAGRRRLGWADIERVTVDRRNRLGVRTELVEIDAGEAIYQFSRHELGADCDEVVARLTELRTGVSR